MMMMALRMRSFFRSIVRERENKRVVWGVNKGANSDVFFSTKHARKHAQYITKQQQRAGERGENIMLSLPSFTTSSHVLFGSSATTTNKKTLRRRCVLHHHHQQRVSALTDDDVNDDVNDDEYESSGKKKNGALNRREMMFKTTKSFALTALGVSSLVALKDDNKAQAFTRPPPGFDLFIDTIDGYEFLRPSSWVEVKGSGNDIFYRNPRNVEENCFVAISSPSSNVYASVRDVGTPEETAEKILKQTLIELTSTRLGIIRESEVVSAKEDLDKDGTAFYDITLRIKSYAAKNQYGLTPEDRPQTLEWDRTFYSRLGTENGRLYELRMQSPSAEFEESKEQYLAGMGKSFRPFEVDTPPPSVGKQLGLNFI